MMNRAILVTIGLLAALLGAGRARAICDGVPLLVNHDGSFESGVSNQCFDDDRDAFAEGFAGPGTVCGVQYSLCVQVWVNTWEVHLFVWDSEGGHPGAVLAMVSAEAQHAYSCGEPVGFDEAEITAEVGDEFFVGIQQCSGDWPMYVLADADGPGTGDQCWYNAPGYGWRHVNEYWSYGIRALALGVYLQLPPTPAAPDSWGEIKALFRR